MRTRMFVLIGFLLCVGLVKTDSERDALTTMQESLKEAGSERDLARIHCRMIRELVFYSEGRDLSGPALASMEARAGTYRIVLTVGDRPYYGTIALRDDPLLK